MNNRSNDHTKVEQLMTSAPDIEFAWPKAFGYSEAINQHSNNVRRAHTQ
jgi:hypothetical protein